MLIQTIGTPYKRTNSGTFATFYTDIVIFAPSVKLFTLFVLLIPAAFTEFMHSIRGVSAYATVIVFPFGTVNNAMFFSTFAA